MLRRRPPVLLALLALLSHGCASAGGSNRTDGGAGDGAALPDASARDGAADAPRPDARGDAPSPVDAPPLTDAPTSDAAASGDGAALAASEGGADAESGDASDAGRTCSDGTPVAYSRVSCPGALAAVPGALAAAASGASAGAVVPLSGLDDPPLPCFPVDVCVASDAPTLVFSDDPESPASDGVLYADVLSAGAYRAYVYHANADASPRKFPVVLLNQGATTVHATVTAKGVAGPSTDYITVGKAALQRWLTSRGATTTVDVPAGARVLLAADLDAVHASTSELSHAIVDFTLDGPVKLSVVSVLATEDATVVTSGLSLLPNDGMHARGSFPGASLRIEAQAPVDGAGARHLRLGAGVTDATLTGHSYVDGTSVTLGGNYGVSYALHVPFAATGASALLLSAQGGDWGGAASLASGVTTLPASQTSLNTQTDAIVLGTVASGATADLTLMSAGGSSLPVDFVTAPLP